MWDLPRPGLATHVPCIGRQILNHCATREALGQQILMANTTQSDLCCDGRTPGRGHLPTWGMGDEVSKKDWSAEPSVESTPTWEAERGWEKKIPILQLGLNSPFISQSLYKSI